MSVVKIEQDLKLLEEKLEAINTTITDPIERNEYKKEIEKKIKKLNRTKNSLEQLDKEQQELESLRLEFISNSDELDKSIKPEVNDRDKIEVAVVSEESTSTISSPSVRVDSRSNSNSQSKLPSVKILLLIISGILLTTTVSIALIFNYSKVLKVEEAKMQETARDKVFETEVNSAPTRTEKPIRPKSIQTKNKIQKNPERAENTPVNTSPKYFIEKHYFDLNNRNYYSTWNYLTAQFQNKSKSFDDYKDWWNSVSYTEIEDIEILEQTNSKAVLDVRLNYVMKTGEVYRDPKSIIYLVWNKYANDWMFEDKQYKYFNNYQFPLSSCGDLDPGGANTWYPVFIENTEHNYIQVRDRFCHDAIRKYREDRQITSIQAASFINKAKAEEFALILKNNLGTGEVGSPKVRNFDDN